MGVLFTEYLPQFLFAPGFLFIVLGPTGSNTFVYLVFCSMFCDLQIQTGSRTRFLFCKQVQTSSRTRFLPPPKQGCAAHLTYLNAPPWLSFAPPCPVLRPRGPVCAPRVGGGGCPQQARNPNHICIHANQARTLVIVVVILLITQLVMLFGRL